MTVDPTSVTTERITAEQAREASDLALESLTQRAIEDIYKAITYAAKEGSKRLEYNLTARGFTRVPKEALTREFASNGYSVKFDEYYNCFNKYSRFILLKWD